MTAILTETVTTPVETPPLQPTSARLRDSVRESLRQYFIRLENTSPANLYEMVLTEMETPLLEIVLQHVNQNQSRAAKILAISRGTLRKKMQQYGMLPNPKKR